MVLYLDIETFSPADLPKVGAWKYAQHPKTRILMIAYAFDEEEVRVWECHAGPLPQNLEAALRDPSVLKIAHNASFELALLSTVGLIEFRPEEWRCTSVHALGLGLPGGLAAVAAELGLDEQKSDTNKTLIRRFSMPPRTPGAPQPGPSDPKWQEFVDYCAQDVRTERAIYHNLMARRPLPDREWFLWRIDQRINQRGLPVDLDLVRGALKVDEINRDRSTAAVREMTGVENPGSRDQLLRWMSSQEVVPENLTADTVKRLLADPQTPEPVLGVLEHRQQLAASSTAKYSALLRATGDDGRLRGTLKFNGAHTGRWSGQIFQPQNLPRGVLTDLDIATARALVKEGDTELLFSLYDNPSQVLASLVRSAIVAPKGMQLVVADLSSIESVILAWCANSKYLLDLFRSGRDSYIDFATRLFDIPYESVSKKQRTLCKPATLGGGFGLGGPGLKRYAESFGLVLTDEQAARHVQVFRESYPDIPALWRDLNTATFRAMSHPGTKAKAGRCVFHYDGSYLWCELPTGRFLAYRSPRLDRVETPYESRKVLSYLAREGKNVRIPTFHGRITENIVQAIARDVLAMGMARAERDSGLEVIGSVHDELICLAREEDGGALKWLINCMTTPPAWGKDIPLKAAGWTGPVYRKD